MALGRAIVRRPLAFLMDEPLGTLDTEFRDLMCEELRHLHDRIRATTVYVTHDQLEAMSMADKIAIMNNGRVEQLGSPQEIYDRPATLFVADFIGSPSMNLIPVADRLARGASALSVSGASIMIPEIREDAPSEDLVLGARPEHIRFDDASGYRGEIFGTPEFSLDSLETRAAALREELLVAAEVLARRDLLDPARVRALRARVDAPGFPRRPAVAVRQGIGTCNQIGASRCATAGGKMTKPAGSMQGFPLARCEAMGEGARRAGEGSCLRKEYSLRSELISRKSPHPAFGHLDHDQARSYRSGLINVIGILDWARDRTENRRPLFLIARRPSWRTGEGEN